MKNVDNLLFNPLFDFLLVNKITIWFFTAEEKCDFGEIYILSISCLFHEMLLFLQITSKWSKTSANGNENDFFPFHSIIEGRLSQFGFHLAWLRVEKFGNKSIFNNTGHNHDIFLSLVRRTNCEQSWCNRIRKLNKILKPDLDLFFFDDSEQEIPVFRIINFLSDPSEFFCGFGAGVSNKVILIIWWKFRQFL